MPADYIIQANLTADDKLSAVMEKAAGRTETFGRKVADAEKRTKKFKAALASMKGNLAAMGIAAGAREVGQYTRALIRAGAEMQNLGFQFQSAFQGNAGAQLRFVAEEADRLGFSMATAAGSYSKFAVGASQAGLSVEAMQQTFVGVTEGLRAAGAGADATARALRALEQMASKTTVMSEELKGQLGEALPGAFGFASQAMGVTTAELNKMLERGEVLAADLLPKLGKVLHNTFSGHAARAASSLTAETERFGNAVGELGDAILRSPVGKWFADMTRGATNLVLAIAGVAREYETLASKNQTAMRSGNLVLLQQQAAAQKKEVDQIKAKLVLLEEARSRETMLSKGKAAAADQAIRRQRELHETVSQTLADMETERDRIWEKQAAQDDEHEEHLRRVAALEEEIMAAVEAANREGEQAVRIAKIHADEAERLARIQDKIAKKEAQQRKKRQAEIQKLRAESLRESKRIAEDRMEFEKKMAGDAWMTWEEFYIKQAAAERSAAKSFELTWTAVLGMLDGEWERFGVRVIATLDRINDAGGWGNLTGSERIGAMAPLVAAAGNTAGGTAGRVVAGAASGAATGAAIGAAVTSWSGGWGAIIGAVAGAAFAYFSGGGGNADTPSQRVVIVGYEGHGSIYTDPRVTGTDPWDSIYGSGQDVPVHAQSAFGGLGISARHTGDPLNQFTTILRLIVDTETAMARLMTDAQVSGAMAAQTGFYQQGDLSEQGIAQIVAERFFRTLSSVSEELGESFFALTNGLQSTVDVSAATAIAMLHIEDAYASGKPIFTDVANSIEAINIVFEQFVGVGELATNVIERMTATAAILAPIGVQTGTVAQALGGAEAVSAAGGVDPLGTLVTDYMQDYLSAAEIAQATIDALTPGLELGLAELGTTAESFAEDFQAAIASGLTGEDLVRWLQFATVLSTVNDAVQVGIDARLAESAAREAEAEALYSEADAIEQQIAQRQQLAEAVEESLGFGTMWIDMLSTSTDRFRRSEHAFVSMAGTWDLTVDGMRDIAAAARDWASTARAVLADVASGLNYINSLSSPGGFFTQLRTAGMTEEERYDFFTARAQTGAQGLQGLGPAELNTALRDIVTSAQQAWGILDQEQQATAGGDFLEWLSDITGFSTAQLQDAAGDVIDAGDSMADIVVPAFEAVGTQMQKAADMIREAGNVMHRASLRSGDAADVFSDASDSMATSARTIASVWTGGDISAPTVNAA